MNYFNIKISDCVIEVGTIHTRPFAMCRHFITDEKPTVSIHVQDFDIEIERAVFKKKYQGYCYWDGNLEVTTLLRLVTNVLIDYGSMLLHGAAVAYKNMSFVFTASSNTGKTTHILKWLDHLPEAYVINGDKPFIKFPEDGSQPLACGSPWAGKENMYTNTMVPLKSIILMERAEDNHMEQISFAKAFPALLQQTYRPEDEEKMRKTLRLLQRLHPAVSFWRFQCNNFKDDCFEVAYNALVRGQA